MNKPEPEEAENDSEHGKGTFGGSGWWQVSREVTEEEGKEKKRERRRRVKRRG